MKITKKQLIIAVIILAGLVVAYRLGQTRQTEDGNAAVEREAIELRDQVGKLMVVPDEVPGVATVVDQSRVANEPFFAQAENGDKILVFAAARKVILYRPSANKIIEATTLVLPTR